ncbi:RICIN domain-containing protein [Streptomyces sp. C36]|uniref:RICIN domain-containing protein n=1 Tax=Streptomyces sp. C36 TaxID=3237122 RepID=UPI0034C60F7A
MKKLSKTIGTLAIAAAITLTSPGTGHASEGTHLGNQGSNKCLEVENSSTRDGARVQQWSCTSSAAGQYWRTATAGQSGGPSWAFYIINSNSDKCLEIADSRTDNGAPAQQWLCDPGNKTQMWYFNNGAIVNLNSGKVLEIADSSTSNGARAQQWLFSPGAPGQLWNY